MPNLDGFRRVLFNAGEQGVSADYNMLQRQFHMLVLEMFGYGGMTNMTQQAAGVLVNLDPEQNDWAMGADGSTVAFDVALCPFPASGYVVPGLTARTLTVGSAGPIVQVLDDTVGIPDETHPTVASYWLQVGDFTLTTAIGDATHPRVDLVEMKLEYVDTSLETRVYNQEANQATLDLDPLTANVDTIIRARAGGTGGNHVSIALVAGGTGTGTLTASGNALTFHFQTGVTTVANFETAVTASDLIEIDTAGTPANVLASPGDVLTATHLVGGTNSIIVGSPLDKATRVQATFQIKQGTPAAAPVYPTPSTGFVPVAAVLVPTLHNAVHSIINLRDMRWPLGGVRVYEVAYKDFNWGGGGSWSLSETGWRAVSASAGTIRAVLPSGTTIGRLVGVAAYGEWTGATQVARLEQIMHTGADPVTYVELANLDANIATVLASASQQARENALMLGDDMNGTGLYLGKRATGLRVCSPMWTNCLPAGPAAHNLFDGSVPETVVSKLGLKMQNAGAGCHLSLVRFYVAHGMR
jgi:hypothetical protein